MKYIKKTNYYKKYANYTLKSPRCFTGEQITFRKTNNLNGKVSNKTPHCHVSSPLRHASLDAAGAA